MDRTINEVMKKHEYEYLQAYNIYVKHKETELRSLIDQITARTCDRAANEKKLKRLEESERLLRAENQE